MLAAEALQTDAQPLFATCSIKEALSRMNACGVDRLPVINAADRHLLGEVRTALLKTVDDKEAPLSSLELDDAVKVFSNQHVFHAIRLMLQYELRILPVIDDYGILLGLLQKQQVLESLSGMLNLTEFGSVITIRLDMQDFALSEIVQLIEVEGGKILGITVEAPTGNKKVYEVSIKLNLQDVSRVASALRRYGYTIFTEAQDESYNTDIETRAGELLHFMDM